jgi:hypothetical protein
LISFAYGAIANEPGLVDSREAQYGRFFLVTVDETDQRQKNESAGHGNKRGRKSKVYPSHPRSRPQNPSAGT